MHPDVEEIQRFVHGELSLNAANSFRSHLEACEDCRMRVESADREEAETDALLSRLDHEPPILNADSVMVGTRPNRPAAWRWAAAVLLTISAAAAAAWVLPGSPMGALLYLLLNRSDSQQPPPTPVTPVPADPGAGIAVPAGESLVILFATPQPSGTADISFSEDGDVRVRARSGAARFQSDENALRIDNTGSTATFEIVIPQSARRIEIRIGQERVFLKADQEIVTDAPRIDGRFRISLTRTRD